MGNILECGQDIQGTAEEQRWWVEWLGGSTELVKLQKRLEGECELASHRMKL